jgi:hypothetical protein
VDNEDVRTKIIHGLGGGCQKEDTCLDLMEVVAIILIPTLLKAASQDALPDNIVKPKEGLMQYVLNMILHDTTGSRKPKQLSKSLIQRILISYGETELACNEELVAEMLECAQSGDGELALEAFQRALTEDVRLYDIQAEARLTTNYDDVFLTRNHREKWPTAGEHDEESGTITDTLRQELHQKSVKLNRRYTAASIDFVAGTYRSKTLTVTLLAIFTLSYFASYRSIDVDVEVCDEEGTGTFVYGASWNENAEALACSATGSVFKWLTLFFAVSLAGLFFIGLGSIGNDILCRRFYLPLFGVFIVVLLVFGQSEMKLVKPDLFYLQVAILCLGIIAILLHLSHAAVLLVPKKWMRKFPRLESIIVSDGIMSAVSAKRAAAHKVNLLIKNALDLVIPKDTDVVLDTHYGQGLLAFSKFGKRYEDIDFRWIFERVYNRHAFDREGIFLSARLLAANVSQYIVTIFILIAGIQLTKRVIEEYSKEYAKEQSGEYVDLMFNRTLDDDLVNAAVANISHALTGFLAQESNQAVFGQNCPPVNLTGLPESACELVNGFYQCDDQALSVNNSSPICTLLDYSANTSSPDGLLVLGLLEASGFDSGTVTEIARQAMNAAAQSSIDSLYPAEPYMISIPIIVGSVVAFLTALSLAITYLPSVTATTLKLRSGVIPTFRDQKNFEQYRVASDQVTVLTGSMFWGCFISSLLAGSLVGAIVFVFLWQATVALVQQFLALTIGILTVIIIKLIMVHSCRCTMYQAFYRKRPAAANISALALECANFALSVGFVFLRMVKLMVVGALYIGRIDTPFLAEGVGKLGNFELDNYPRIFIKDILATEAHRHPYINLLGVMYLMKLRYGKHFGTPAGSCWRLIFVYALMPWLNKYRVLTRENIVDSNVTLRGAECQSLRKSLLDDEENAEEAAESQPRQLSSIVRRELSMKSNRSLGATLLAQEIGAERLLEVEQENRRLQVKVGDLADEVSRLKALLETASSTTTTKLEEETDKNNVKQPTLPPRKLHAENVE